MRSFSHKLYVGLTTNKGELLIKEQCKAQIKAVASLMGLEYYTLYDSVNGCYKGKTEEVIIIEVLHDSRSMPALEQLGRRLKANFSQDCVGYSVQEITLNFI